MCAEESVKEELVIQCFRELNVTELIVRGNKEEEEKRHGRDRSEQCWAGPQ